jgi:hypothetical protein
VESFGSRIKYFFHFHYLFPARGLKRAMVAPSKNP